MWQEHKENVTWNIIIIYSNLVILFWNIIIIYSNLVILYTVRICLSLHICSWSIFPDLRIFWITESPISPDVEIGSHYFCRD